MFTSKNRFDKTLHRTQKRMLKYAQELGKLHGLDLDYTHESIPHIDRIVAEARKELADNGLQTESQIENDEGTQGICESLGCYIVETIERNLGKGEWLDANPETGEPEYCFRLSDSRVIFPFTWVMKSLVDKNYSVASTYKRFVAIE